MFNKPADPTHQHTRTPTHTLLYTHTHTHLTHTHAHPRRAPCRRIPPPFLAKGSRRRVSEGADVCEKTVSSGTAFSPRKHTYFHPSCVATHICIVEQISHTTDGTHADVFPHFSWQKGACVDSSHFPLTFLSTFQKTENNRNTLGCRSIQASVYTPIPPGCRIKRRDLKKAIVLWRSSGADGRRRRRLRKCQTCGLAVAPLATRHLTNEPG
jgi:hypothetical protein